MVCRPSPRNGAAGSKYRRSNHQSVPEVCTVVGLIFPLFQLQSTAGPGHRPAHRRQASQTGSSQASRRTPRPHLVELSPARQIELAILTSTRPVCRRQCHPGDLQGGRPHQLVLDGGNHPLHLPERTAPHSSSSTPTSSSSNIHRRSHNIRRIASAPCINLLTRHSCSTCLLGRQ